MRLSINKKEMPDRTGEAVIKSELPDLKVKFYYPKMEDYPDYIFDFSEFWKQPSYFIVDEDGFRDHKFYMEVVQLCQYVDNPELLNAADLINRAIAEQDPLWGVNLAVPHVQEVLSKISRYYHYPAKHLADWLTAIRREAMCCLDVYTDPNSFSIGEEENNNGTNN